jgi:hypothetical protein
MSEEERRPILEEHSVPEIHGLLGGKNIESTPDGRLQRTSFITTCDYCGNYPLKNFVICRSCRGKLCTNCTVKVDGRPYCRNCLTEVLPLTRNGFKVLSCINARLDDANRISKIVKLDKDSVKLVLTSLNEQKYVTTSGLFAFMERKITAEGTHVLSVYSQVFGRDEDVIEVVRKLQVVDDGR